MESYIKSWWREQYHLNTVADAQKLSLKRMRTLGILLWIIPLISRSRPGRAQSKKKVAHKRTEQTTIHSESRKQKRVLRIFKFKRL